MLISFLTKQIKQGKCYKIRLLLNHVNFFCFQPKNYPRVLLGVFIDKPTPFIEEFLAKVTALDYPPKKVSLFLYNNVSEISLSFYLNLS